MIDLGIVKPGSTVYIPFNTYDSNDPSASATITGLAVGDIKIYKDGSTTERASTSGFTLLDTDGIDFDSLTGIHGFSVDLADNTTAGFYAAGSRYWVVVSDVTLDAATVRFVAATFTIGYPEAILNTTIATLSSQTSFTLTDGPAEDDALNGMWCIIHDVASQVQLGTALISDYTGSTKTVTLAAGTTYTAAATDNISIMGLAPLQPTTLGNKLDVTSTGAAGIDWGNVENPSTSVDLSATSINLCDTITTYTGNTVQTGDAYARLGAPAGASVSADIATIDSNVDAILVDTAEIGAAGAGLSAVPWNAAWDAEVQSEVNDGLVAIGLDHLVAASVTGTDITDNSIIAKLVSKSATADWDSFNNTTDSLEAVRDKQTDIETDTQDLQTQVGAAGAGLSAIPWNASWDAEVQSEVTDGLNAYDPPTRTEATADKDAILAKLLAYVQLLARSDAAIATDNATELNAINTNEGSGAGTFDNTTEATQAIRDHIGDGTNLTEAGGDGDHLTAINLPNQTMDITGNLSGSVGSVSGNVDGSIGSLGAQAKLDVNAECDTAISDASLATAAALATVDSNVDTLKLGVITGTAQTGTLSTTQATSDLTGYADDQLIGRVIIFTSGPADGEATDITDYASASGLLTFTALTTSPANGNTFKIV